jgi:hypothetical protein
VTVPHQSLDTVAQQRIGIPSVITREQHVRREVAAWLGTYRWQLYVVVTYAHDPRPETVQRTTGRWVVNFQRDFPTAFVYVSPDCGSERGRWNVHLLVGGLFTGKPPREPFRTLAITRALAIAQRYWRHGMVKTAQPYDPRRGAVRYVAKYWADAEVPPLLHGRPLRRSHAQ